MRKNIKLFDPVISKEEEEEIITILKSGYWASGSGKGLVGKFENVFNKFVHAKKSIAVNSGTAALHLALSNLNIKNKEVILPSLSFVSTAHAIIYNQGIPVFADIENETLCIDAKKIKEKISSKTKAIIPVHFAGLPSDLNSIKKIAEKYNLTVIEDAAHACGTKYNGKYIGTHSDYVCFSFHPVKNLAMPNGGLISVNTINAEAIMKKINSQRWCGITDRKNQNYDVKEIGWNFYMNEFSAGIGLIQLKKLEKLNHKRRKTAEIYSKEFKMSEKMKFDNQCSYHFYWIIVKNRKEFMKKMLENGIETGIHYRPIHKMSMYKNNEELENTEATEGHIVSIPTHPNLTTKNIEKIVKCVNKFY